MNEYQALGSIARPMWSLTTVQPMRPIENAGSRPTMAMSAMSRVLSRFHQT